MSLNRNVGLTKTHKREAADGPRVASTNFPQPAGKDEGAEWQGDPLAQPYEGEEASVHIGNPGSDDPANNIQNRWGG